MKINYLKINGFGKIKNKEIKLNKNKINLIYGENESGKSTILKFIAGIIYGVSKNKNNKDISDLDKYTPWNNDEFSGKIKYELDNKEEFEIFRDFKKKNIKIYNKESKDISNEFNINKNKDIEFFYEQTKIDEPLFFSTTLVEQQEVALDNNNQNILIQKIANLLSSGDNNISYKKSMEKLNNKLKEEVGTPRTTDKPLNNILEKISYLNNEKEKLNEYINRKELIEKQKELIQNNLNKKEIKLNLIKELKIIKEEANKEEEKINYINKRKNEYNEKINNLKNKIKTNNNDNKKEIKKYPELLIFGILIILNVIAGSININKYINYILITISIIYLLFNFINYFKNGKKNKINNEIEINNLNKINNEIELLEKEFNNEEKEFNELNNNLKIINNKLELIKNKYNNKINLEEINILLENKLEIINNKYDLLSKEIIDNKLELNIINNQEKDISNKLEEKASYEEELSNLEEQKNELLSLQTSINLARETLEESYNKMKSEFTPKFTKELSKLSEEISNR